MPSHRALLVVALSFGACGSDPKVEATPELAVGGNVMVILADDLGIEHVGAFGGHQGLTPNIDALAKRGLRFDNAYVYSMCSPTRSAMLTGQFARRTGFGSIVEENKTRRYTLPTDAPSVARMAKNAGYATSMVGKWHLAEFHEYNHPREMGFDWHAGSPTNPQFHRDELGHKTNYFRWDKNTNGKLAVTTKYMTTDTVDDALTRIKAMPEPWFLWVAFNAPHFHFHKPPEHLYDSWGASLNGGGHNPWKFRAMIEALDKEIGRLLSSVAPAVMANTTVIFLSDNGTPPHATYPPARWDRSKGSLYEGGVRSPLIVAGPGVRPGVADQLVHAVDLLPTVADLIGVDLEGGKGADAVDGRSFADVLRAPSTTPGREFLFSEQFGPNGGGRPSSERRSVRDATYKLIRGKGKDSEQLFKITPGVVDEGADLLARQEKLGEKLTADDKAALERLQVALDKHAREVKFAYGDHAPFHIKRADAKPKPEPKPKPKVAEKPNPGRVVVEPG